MEISSTIRLMAKSAMALPNMETTVPAVIIVKSRVHKDAAGLLLSSISDSSLFFPLP